MEGSSLKVRVFDSYSVSHQCEQRRVRATVQHIFCALTGRVIFKCFTLKANGLHELTKLKVFLLSSVAGYKVQWSFFEWQ